ncbi:MAG TPA: RcnB family protein [Terracidiphilus sp.]|jgi:Ni/Co efflux regulator RcnB
MKPMMKSLAASALFVALCGGTAIAQDHHDDRDHHHDQYVKHDEWKKGQHMKHEDWERAQRVEDWRAHHLRRPPNGYEWRDVDGQYVLGNTDGVIFQVVLPH